LRAFGFVFSRVALLDFCDLLGYTRAVDDPKRYTISREKQFQADGKIADAVLGEFSPSWVKVRPRKTKSQAWSCEAANLTPRPFPNR
jgi:hypothetical protein